MNSALQNKDLEVIHFCPSMSFSGLEQYALQLAVDQKKRGFSIGFVVAPGSQLETECLKHQIVTIPFVWQTFAGQLSLWRRLHSILKGDQKKVFHLHSTQEIFHMGGAVFLNKFKRRKNLKVILQIHIWVNHRKKDLIHRVLYSLVDEIWCSSHPARKNLLQNLPAESSKVKIVKYGRDLISINQGLLSRVEAREKLRLPSELTLFATVSRLEKSKGILEFLEATLPGLSRNRDVGIAIVGSVSPNNSDALVYEDALKVFVQSQSASVRERIFFLGTIPDSYRYLKAFDVYVLPSYQECFSLGLLDAQASGLPTIGSNSGGTPEVVIEGVTGWLFQAENTASLKDAFERTLANKKSWETFGEAAKSRVKKDFDQKLIFEDIIKEYALIK